MRDRFFGIKFLIFVGCALAILVTGCGPAKFYKPVFDPKTIPTPPDFSENNQPAEPIRLFSPGETLWDLVWFAPNTIGIVETKKRAFGDYTAMADSKTFYIDLRKLKLTEVKDELTKDKIITFYNNTKPYWRNADTAGDHAKAALTVLFGGSDHTKWVSAVGNLEGSVKKELIVKWWAESGKHYQEIVSIKDGGTFTYKDSKVSVMKSNRIMVTDDAKYLVCDNGIVHIDSGSIITNTPPVNQKSYSAPPNVIKWTFDPGFQRIAILYFISEHEPLLLQITDYRFPAN